MTALPKTSFAMVQTGIRTLEPRDLPIPDIDDDAGILRLEACGICGSDYEQFEGQLRTPMPVVPGHEPLGVIARIGDRAETPVCLAAVNRGMIRAAAACADGLIGHSVFTRRYIAESVLPQLEGSRCDR